MSPHDLRNQIDQILLNPRACEPDAFVETATQYANLVQNLNRRLTLSNRWIDLGLRCEAIHMASLEPDILDCLGAVDLGEDLHDWNALCEANNAPSPERANWEQATYLNEAWDIEERLSPQLRDLRAAILRKETIACRIGILRCLLEIDSNNLAWDTMTRELEQLRILEIENELEEASAQQDLIKLKALENEVHSADWREPPPMDLLSGSMAERRKAKKARVKQQYIKIAKALHAAMYAGDPIEANRLRNMWEQLHEISTLKPLREAADEAEVVFAWLDELNQEMERETAYTTSCDELNTLLDANADIDKIEKAYFKLKQFEMGIPPLLETRYTGRTAEAERTRRIKLVTKSVLAVAAVAAVAILATIYFRHANYTNRQGAFQSSLNKAIIDENITVLEALIASGPVEFPNQFPEQLNQAKEMIEEDQARQELFVDLFGTLSHRADSGEILNIRESTIEELEQLARSKDELGRSKSLRSRWNDARDHRSAIVLAELRRTYESTRLQLNEVNSNFDHEQPGILLGECRGIQNTIRDLRTELLAVEGSVQLTSQLDILSESVNTTMDRIRTTQAQQETTMLLYARLRLTQDSMESHFDSLLALGDAPIDSQDKREIQQTLQARTLLNQMVLWNHFGQRLPNDLLDLHRQHDAHRELIQDLKVLPEHNRLPGGRLDSLMDFTNSVSDMHLPEHRPDRKLASFINPERPWANPRLNRLVTKNGNYYALSPEAKFEKNESGNKGWMLWGYVKTSEDIMNRKPGLKTLQDDELAPGLDKTMPLSKTGLQEWLDHVNRNKRLRTPPKVPTLWYLDLLESLLAIEHMEPTVKLAIAARIASLHEQFGWPSISEITELAEYANGEPPPQWPNPDTDIDERAIATEALIGLDSNLAAAWKQEAMDQLKAMQNTLPRSMVFSGCIWVSETNQRKIYLYDQANRTGAIYALLPSNSGRLELQAIASRIAGVLSIEPPGSVQYKAMNEATLGMPVFMSGSQ